MVRSVLFHETGGPEVLTVTDTPAAEPGPGELRLRVEAFGLNRAETMFRSGTYGEAVRSFPARLGYEAAGVVEALGEGVTGFAPGDPVAVVPAFSMSDYGTYGSSAVVPAAAVVPRPPEVDAVTGAAVWMAYVTAYGGLIETGGLRAGETVLVTAASSSVGLAALQIARRAGAVPLATTRSAAKRDQLLAAGAEDVIVTAEEDLAARVAGATGGRGADLLFDPVAGRELPALARAARPGGRLVLYGTLGEGPTELPVFAALRDALSIRGYSITSAMADPAALHRATAYVNSGLRDGTFRPTVDRTFDLEDIVEAHRHLESNAQVGKIVVTVRH